MADNIHYILSIVYSSTELLPWMTSTSFIAFQACSLGGLCTVLGRPSTRRIRREIDH
ncbi:nitrate/sulfonate/bicarbonate ABC transporter ATP-binding protein [Sesbania bispinosa]|nr:nitrate/sulfonate/bicarbonate ABC transporter ATP-binding protein [Sesbania bispinosa]